jgi:beta-glucosidase
MKQKTIKTILATAALIFSSSLFAQTWLTPEAEKRADDLLKSMTVREKLIYIGGIDWMFTKSIPRVGIPSVKMSDASQGLTTWGQSTAYPCMLMLASTWNRTLAGECGGAVASDCRARGVNILLGPGVNIYRAPMCGRNFEYMGEDPYLTAQTSTGYIKGLQERGVMAVVKHFAGNFQEYDRNYISSDIDERTLHEIYFPAFKSAVQQAETGAVMTSYNLLNGVWTTEDPWLLKDVLRTQWGFNGLVMSDWGSTHNCVPAVKSGMDLEMAGNEIENEDALRKYLESGDISMTDIDLKVKHILRTLIAFGFFDREQLDATIPLNNPASVQTSLNISREGVVLLKNQDNILPLTRDKFQKIAVIGNNALIYAAGGGSGLVTPFAYTSYFDGLKMLGGEKGFDVAFVDKYDHFQDVLFTASGSDEKGLKGEYFNNKDLSGTPLATKTDLRIGYEWTMGCGVEGINKNDFSVRWTGELRPVESAAYDIIVSGDDGYRLFIDGVKVIDEYADGAFRERRYTKTLTAGQNYAIRLEYFQAGGGASIDFAWIKQGDENRFKNELDKADVIVAFIGHSSASEGEASDRSFTLPANAQTLITEAQQSDKPMIAAVNAGGNVYMQDWEPKLKGLLWGWYGGQEAGTAMAEILLGDLNPSGKLPITFEKRWEDNPVYNSYYDTDGDKRVAFTEGVFMGYRGYDKLNRAVQYPFGYGLSYTTFHLSDMQAIPVSDGENLFEVSFTVKNTGTTAGAEVVQLYVNKQDDSPVERPLRELKNYEKIYLAPGEEKSVTLTLDKEAFSYYSLAGKRFVVDDGDYKIELGTSSRDIKLSAAVKVDNTLSLSEIRNGKKNGFLIPSMVKAGEKIKIAQGTAERVRIYNLNGQIVKTYSDTGTIETGNLSSGIYAVHFVINDVIYNEKMAVK